MERGIDDVIARYPDAWNLNNFAKFACLALDRAKTKELLGRIGDSIVPQAWSSKSQLEQCARWSSQPPVSKLPEQTTAG
jgi:hypothetical protein